MAFSVSGTRSKPPATFRLLSRMLYFSTIWPTDWVEPASTASMPARLGCPWASALYETTGMTASSAWLTGALKAFLSTTASAIPSALAEIAALVAFTISATTASFEPVHWKSQLSSAQASWAPYWVGVKNGLVVTWLTNTNFHLGVEGKSPEPAAAALPPDGSSEPQAASSAEAASVALARPVPFSSRRRVIGLSPSVSTACSTAGSTLDMGTSSCGFPTLSVVGGEPVDGGRVVLLARPQHGRREVVMVGRVRVVLGLQR